MQPTIARKGGQLDPRCSMTDIPPPQSAALGLHTVAHRLLLINRPRRDGTLSWCWYTAALGGIWTCDLTIASQTPTQPQAYLKNHHRCQTPTQPQAYLKNYHRCQTPTQPQAYLKNHHRCQRDSLTEYFTRVFCLRWWPFILFVWNVSWNKVYIHRWGTSETFSGWRVALEINILIIWLTDWVSEWVRDRWIYWSIDQLVCLCVVAGLPVSMHVLPEQDQVIENGNVVVYTVDIMDTSGNPTSEPKASVTCKVPIQCLFFGWISRYDVILGYHSGPLYVIWGLIVRSVFNWW